MADAGWYDDPMHRFIKRYFDGEKWTEHVVGNNGKQLVDKVPVITSPAIQQTADSVSSKSTSKPLY